MLLDEVPSRHRRRRVFRLVWDRRSDLLPKYNLDSDGEQEMRDLLLEGRGPFTAEEYCDETFRPKQGLQARRRFSDGSFPVFYSSLDPETADEEIRYWFPRYGPRKARTGFYSRLACSFSGLEKDRGVYRMLRPKSEQSKSRASLAVWFWVSRIGFPSTTSPEPRPPCSAISSIRRWPSR